MLHVSGGQPLQCLRLMRGTTKARIPLICRYFDIHPRFFPTLPEPAFSSLEWYLSFSLPRSSCRRSIPDWPTGVGTFVSMVLLTDMGDLWKDRIVPEHKCSIILVICQPKDPLVFQRTQVWITACPVLSDELHPPSAARRFEGGFDHLERAFGMVGHVGGGLLSAQALLEKVDGGLERRRAGA